MRLSCLKGQKVKSCLRHGSVESSAVFVMFFLEGGL